MGWQALDREKSQKIIAQVLTERDAGLFNPLTSEAECQAVPFYRSFLHYRIRNYASLPIFTMQYLSDGTQFFQLDGAAQTIYSVNEKAGLLLNMNTLLPYMRFFLENVALEDGEVYLVDDLNSLPFMESIDDNKKTHIRENYHAPKVDYEPALGAFIVNCTLYFMNTLMHASVRIDEDGVVSILDQSMLTQGGAEYTLPPRPTEDWSEYE